MFVRPCVFLLLPTAELRVLPVLLRVTFPSEVRDRVDDPTVDRAVPALLAALPVSILPLLSRVTRLPVVLVVLAEFPTREL